MDMLELPLALIFLLLAVPAHAQLPYHPTRVFRSTKHDNRLYVYGPAPSASSHAQLRSLDVSSNLDSANLEFTTLYDTLPWSSAERLVPYLAAAEAKGNLTVYAGDCADSAQDAKIWTFEVDDDSENGNGTWTSADVAVGDSARASNLAPNFLGSAMSFSTSDDGSNTSLFVFGGMCPDTDATQDSWQSSANYSNTMVQLAPDSTAQYTLNVAPTRGPPVAEAGFDMVALPPSFSSDSDGSRDQQQNFVLIGGHTQSAYINMSQVALYSLPQETWTFLGVDQPSTEHTGLAKRDQVTEVEPRSGHTTLLTADGSKIIVFGGWVGDVNTPADPQLAVLNVGEGYGGDGAWHWTVPSTEGTGLTNGAGIYGHGAVMLTGDVMMVVGGYSISSTSSRFRSRADLAQNTRNYFLNVTSNTWISEYSPTSDSSSSDEQSTTSKVGLGAGLGIGLAAVLAMAVFYFWYKRYLRRKREIREKEITREAYSYNATGPYGNGGGYADYLNNRDAAALASDPFYENDRTGWKAQRAQEAERTGLLVEIPSPTRGLRRSLHGRAYHQAPRYEEGRVNQGSGGIHPIDEEEEIESATNERTGMPEMSERPRTAENRISIVSTTASSPARDPFTDPDPLRSHPVLALAPQNVVHFPTSLKSTGNLPIQLGPSSPMQTRTTDVRAASPNWELVANNSGNNSGSSSGRSFLGSADRSDRTESNLSERTARSGLSSMSARSGAASVARTLSNASAAFLATIANPFSSANATSTNERRQLSIHIPGQSSPARGSGDSVVNSGRPNADDDSFRTAKTSFAKLQAEGEALLGGRPGDIEDLPAPSGYPSSTNSDKESPNLIHTPVDFYPRPSFEQYREQEQEAGPSQQPETPHKLTHTGSSDTLDLTTPVDNSFATRDRSKSWLRGSVRLALTHRPSSSHRHSMSHDRTQSLTTTGHRRRRHTNEDDGSGWFNGGGGHRSGSNSPSKLKRHRRSGSGAGLSEFVSVMRPSTAGDEASPPRRANSDASFWRSKRGSKAWSEDVPSPMWAHDDVRNEEDWAVATPDPRKSRESMALSMEGEGEDWDVEAAAEGRVVQVMFTVPRQRLRVVNVDMEQGSGESESGRKVSRESRRVSRESRRVSRESKGKQRADGLGEPVSPLTTPPTVAEELLSNDTPTPPPRNDNQATSPVPSDLTPPPLRPPPIAIAPPQPYQPRDSSFRRNLLPNPQPLHKPPPLSPAFPPSLSYDDDLNDDDDNDPPSPLAPPPLLSQISRSTASHPSAASFISPYAATSSVQPAATNSTSTIGTTATAPESPVVRGRPLNDHRNLLSGLGKERSSSRGTTDRGRGLLTPVKTERPEMGERSKSSVSSRSEGGGSVKDLIREIEAKRNRS